MTGSTRIFLPGGLTMTCIFRDREDYETTTRAAMDTHDGDVRSGFKHGDETGIYEERINRVDGVVSESSREWRVT